MPSKILIIRASAIGDVVMASPLVVALRNTYPSVHIAWLVEPGIHELLLDDPCLDEVILWPKREWRALLKARRFIELARRIRDFRAMLRGHRFDMVLDLQGLLKSGLLAWLTGAPRRIGLGSKEGSQWLMTERYPRGGDHQRISSEYLFLAQKLGLQCDGFLPRMVVAADANERALKLLADLQLQPGQYAVLAPFTTRPQKHWFEESWRELATLLVDQTGLTVLLLGGPDDRAAAEQIVGEDGRCVSLAGITRLPEAAALIEHAALLVGVDTGLTHMGIALNRPTVAIFGSTCPYLNTCRANAQVLWLGKECSPCRRNPTCDGTYPCLREITPELVLETALRVLENGS